MSNILVTGCSSGIGFATALELARAGHQVLATMRHPERAPQLEETAGSEKVRIKVLPLDVDSDESVSACFKAIAEPIDVLVNNAGIGWPPVARFRTAAEEIAEDMRTDLKPTCLPSSG